MPTATRRSFGSTSDAEKPSEAETAGPPDLLRSGGDFPKLRNRESKTDGPAFASRGVRFIVPPRSVFAGGRGRPSRDARGGCPRGAGKDLSREADDSSGAGRADTRLSEVDPGRAWSHRTDRRPRGSPVLRGWQARVVETRPGGHVSLPSRRPGRRRRDRGPARLSLPRRRGPLLRRVLRHLEPCARFLEPAAPLPGGQEA